MSDTREKLVNLSRRRALVERQGTHWDGCATEGGPRHYECAVARIAAANERAEGMRMALEAIQQYGSDTLSGRADGPDDREWQRAAVLEMTKRADAALARKEGE